MLSSPRTMMQTPPMTRSSGLPPLPPRLQDLHERPAAQLLEREAGRERLLLGERARVDAAQEEVEQALAGRRVVEDVAEQRGLGGLLDERLQAVCGLGARLQEERVHGGVAGGELRRVQVPALV